MNKVCLNESCAKTYQTFEKESKYCSRSCSAIVNNKLKQKRTTKNKCKICGKQSFSYKVFRCEEHLQTPLPTKIKNIYKCKKCNKESRNNYFCSRDCYVQWNIEDNPNNIVNKEKIGKIKNCFKCKEDKDLSEFYGRHIYCKSCLNILTMEKQRAVKKKLVDLLGGCCCVCGYNKCQAALEFHHLDRSEKSYGISLAIKQNKKFESIVDEAKKCVLLCSNHHRECESGIIDLEQIKAFAEFI